MAGSPLIELDFQEGSTFRDLVERLARQFPEMVGVIISSDYRSLLSAMLFHRENGETILPDEMDRPLTDGDHLILSYFIVGG